MFHRACDLKNFANVAQLRPPHHRLHPQRGYPRAQEVLVLNSIGGPGFFLLVIVCCSLLFEASVGVDIGSRGRTDGMIAWRF